MTTCLLQSVTAYARAVMDWMRGRYFETLASVSLPNPCSDTWMKGGWPEVSDLFVTQLAAQQLCKWGCLFWVFWGESTSQMLACRHVTCLWEGCAHSFLLNCSLWRKHVILAVHIPMQALDHKYPLIITSVSCIKKRCFSICCWLLQVICAWGRPASYVHSRS